MIAAGAVLPLILMNGFVADANDVMAIFYEIYNNITDDNVSNTANIQWDKMEDLPTGQILVGNGVNKADPADAQAVANLLSHGDLQNLGADDHTQYVLADGTRNFSASVHGQSTVVGDTDTTLATKDYAEDYADGVAATAEANAVVTANAYTDGVVTSHTHTILGGDPATAFGWSLSTSNMTSGGTWDVNGIYDPAWPMSRNGANDGRVYFMRSNASWEVLYNFTVGSGIILSGPPGRNMYTLQSITDVGGGEFYFTLVGLPDLTGYTVAGVSRWQASTVMFYASTAGGPYNYGGIVDGRIYHRKFRTWMRVNNGPISLTYNTTPSAGAICIPTLNGHRMFSGTYDGNNGVRLDASSGAGDFLVTFYNDTEDTESWDLDIYYIGGITSVGS